MIMKFVFLCFCMVTLSSCASKKVVISEEALDAFNSMIANKQFQIDSNWAYPQATMSMQQLAVML